MSFRPGLLPNLLRSTRSQPFTSTFSRSFHRSPPPQSRILALTRPTLRFSPLLFPLALGGTYLTYNSLTSPVKCESPFPSLSTGPKPEVGAGEVPQSEISGYTLGFGAVCGICTGIFVKKGLKAIAFLLGGVFIFMQYMSTKRFITVDWSKLSGTYNNTFGSKTPVGEVRAPTVGGVYAWFVDFVTANFQQRATFLAGLALGLRLG